MSSERMTEAFTEIENAVCGGCGVAEKREKNADFSFEQNEFGTSVGPPGREVQWALEQARLKMRQPVKLGN